MEQLKQAYQEYYYYILFADILIGFLLGLIPLILGIKKHKRNLGIIGLVASIIGGVMSPVISIIVILIFVFLILRKPKTETSPESEEIVKSEPVE